MRGKLCICWIGIIILFSLTGAGVAQEETLATGQCEMLFILGTDENEAALLSAKNNSTLTDVVGVDVYTQNDSIPAINFSQYCVVVIENRTSTDIAAWSAGLDVAKANGTHVIGYRLPHSVSLTDVNQSTYTTFERYWIQGGKDNINNHIMYLGKQLCGKWTATVIPEPQVVRQRVSITYILNWDACNYCLDKVLSNNLLITERFDVHVYLGSEAVSGLHDISHEDVIFLFMVSADEMVQIKDALFAAKANGTQIGLFGMLDTYGVGTLDLSNPPHSIACDYLYNSSEANAEGWIRYTGSEIAGAYIQYPLPAPASVPSYGIYHPDAFPLIFSNSTEYLAWYSSAGSHHVYNSSNITVGIVLPGTLPKEQVGYTLEDAIIEGLESRGCNVITATNDMFSSNEQYFVDANGTVLVDVIISVKGFYLNYGNQAAGVSKLQSFNVPVIKAIGDYYQTPDEYNNSTHGLSTSSIPYQVVQPEIDGCIEYIWVGGRLEDTTTGQYYYQPLPQHVQWLCKRTVRWAQLNRMSNAQKKVAILYYNHEGGKNNIGASYLDSAKSISLVLQRMRAEGYDLDSAPLPNGTELIDLFIESRNVGTWAPGELEKLVQSGYVELVPKEQYLQWYNTLPESVRADMESTWGEPPGDVMVYGDSIVIPRLVFGNVVVMPQPMRATASDEKVLYHSKDVPPTHQYLAAYFWISKGLGADAIVHFGTHGTQEWLPGSEVSLHRYDYPSIMVDDIPVVYPYIMDNVGEGTQAKRRGNAVIIDHLTPPIVVGGLYGELLELNDKIGAYEGATDPALKQSYRDAILDLYELLHLDEDMNMSKSELTLMNDTQFTSFLDNNLTDYIDELRDGYMPYGLHVFGVPPTGQELVSMVESMLGSPFIDHIVAVIPHNGTQREWENTSYTYAEQMLEHVLLNSTNTTYAQMQVLGLVNATISDDLNTSILYASRLNQTTRETDQLLRALNGEYIEPGEGNDPIRNKNALPTGRNFYSFDPRKFPDAQTEALGVVLADQLLSQYMQETGEYPKKVAFVLWSVESMRHRGLMEAEIYALLGVKLKRSSGRIVDFEVIPQSQLGRPRIDVVLVPSGLYRDTFPYQLQLMDSAIRLVANLNESNSTNYVRANSLAMHQQLVSLGYNNTTAWDLAQCRIFSEAPGAYGTGLPEAIAASDTWDDEDKLADLFLSRTCNIYGNTRWGESNEELLRLNIGDVEAAVHSDSSNLYGVIDNDDYYQYLGGIILAVRSLTGSNPKSYVTDLRDALNPQTVTLKHMFMSELRVRYLNPKWIEGMMEFDYAGAREMQKLVEFMWGWDVTDPTLVSDATWQQLYEVYVQDSYGLGVDEFLKSNPYSQQSIAGRMLDAIRKGYWDASDDVKAELVREYVQSVAQNGVACCHHTCGNPSLDAYVQGLVSLPGVSIDMQTYQEYLQQMQDATLRPQQMQMQSSDSGAWRVNETQQAPQAPGVSNDPSSAEGDTQKADEVSGYELSQERQNMPSMPPITSSVPILGLAFVLVIGGMFSIGYLLTGRRGF